MGSPYILILSLIIVVWSWCPAWGRMYQYRDSKGVVHFTDALSKVPHDMLPGVESSGPEKKDSGQETNREEPQVHKEGENQGETGDQGEEAREIPLVEELNREKAALDQEHALLVKRKKTLGKERGTLKTPEDVRAYQKKVRSLNRRIAAYERRNKAYRKKVDAYNAAVKKEENQK